MLYAFVNKNIYKTDNSIFLLLFNKKLSFRRSYKYYCIHIRGVNKKLYKYLFIIHHFYSK